MSQDLMLLLAVLGVVLIAGVLLYQVETLPPAHPRGLDSPRSPRPQPVIRTDINPVDYGPVNYDG